MLKRLTWAEISLKDYAYNLSQIKKLVGPKVKLMAILKANAYGHGAVELACQAEKWGASYIGIVCLYEAEELREAGIKLPILILNYIDPKQAEKAIDLGCTLNIMDEEVLKAVDKYARKKGKRVKIHVKIDSGMHRAGMVPEDALKFIPKIENYKNIVLEGIFTHLATSDEKDLNLTRKQLSIFRKLLKSLKVKGIRPPLIHAANSGATLRLPKSYFDMVRPGIISYGLVPSCDFTLPFKPKPILSWKTIIAQIRDIGKGETVGYGRTFKASKKTLVGLIPVGYGDGLRRALSNRWHVLVKGQKAPILGRISMDQTSIDVTQIPRIKVGDEVVIIGKQGKEKITADKMAAKQGTINYEVVTSLAARVSRIYS